MRTESAMTLINPAGGELGFRIMHFEDDKPALDVKEFGIKVTVVEPSGFRTGFLTKDPLALISSRIEGYKAVKNAQDRYLSANGQQPGDPDRAAEIFMELAETPEPPMHLFLGNDACNRASKKLADMCGELEQWKSITIGTDFK